MVLPNLFADNITYLETGLELSRYVCAVHENLGNYKLDDKLTAGDEEDEEPGDMKWSSNNLFALYDIYD